MKKMLVSIPEQKKSNEKGFASIVIALILIIVLALFTVGFAQLARREQRSALDKQLATQAYYAAESGVNDTERNLAALQASLPDPDTCLGAPVNVGPVENDVQYTCVLVDVKPPVIKYGNVQPEDSRYITPSTISGGGVGATSLTINWGSAAGNNTFAGNTSDRFLPATNWTAAKRPALLEFSITPLNDLSRAGLLNNTFTTFMYPVNSGTGNVAYNPANTGQVAPADCDVADHGAEYPCRVTVTGLTGGTGKYLLRVTNHYDPSNINIDGKDSFGQPIEFVDGQVSIDVTGKAHEVLKRIQVWRSIKPAYDIPGYALSSQSACKHFTTDPSTTQAIALPQDTAGACNLN